MQLTQQQIAFVDVLVNGKGHVCLRARAGTGKTSTLIEGAVAYHKKFPKRKIAICAFAKPVQIEINDKLTKLNINWQDIQAATSHSLGFSAVRPIFKNVKVDNDGKVRDLIRAENAPQFQEFFSSIKEMVHLAKLEGFGFFDDAQIGDVHAWYAMADHYGVNGFDDTTNMDTVIQSAIHIYKKSLEQTDVIDFDDMVLFPLIKGLRAPYPKDMIIVDEAQDTSRARRALMELFLKPGGRLIIVGDDCQAIMGFAGASADALDEWIRLKSAQVLPLTMTWRCPKAVVKEAQTIVPDIVAADGAIEGNIRHLVPEQWLRVLNTPKSEWKPDGVDGSVKHAEELPFYLEKTDAILCRNTAPLVTTAYALIRQGVACRVEGREIGNGLLKLVDRWKVTTVSAFLDKLETYREREVTKAMAKGKESKVVEINDRCDTLIAICEAVKTKIGKNASLDNVRTFISELFTDDVSKKGMLTLCTYHRSKGREWPRVMLLEHASRCPSPWAKQEWEKRQERNLAYVAITRAQRELIYVN
jgi:DNA helicase-2/ATP-dependent DNA helicase PcrA